MQVPKRKKETYHPPKPDPYITQNKFEELSKKLNRLKTIKQPREAKEVKRLALMGDFSENAGYQLAKGRLRGFNQTILEIENQLKYAEIIPDSQNSNTVKLGSLVSIESAQGIKTYRLLGSVESNPDAGIISHNSPLGSALLNHQLGDIISLELDSGTKKYKIIKIE